MDFLNTALKEIGLALKPLTEGATSGDMEEFETLFRQVGIPLDEVMTETEIQNLATGISAIDDLLGEDPEPLDAVTAVRSLESALSSLQGEVPEIDVMNLVDFFIIRQIQLRAPLFHNILVLLGVIIVRRVDPPESLISHVLWRINWEGISKLFQDPTVLLRGAYNWGGDNLDADKLLLNLRNVFWMLHIPAGLQVEDQDSVRGLLGDGSNDPMLRVPALYFQTDPGVWVEAGGAFLPYRRDLTKGYYGLALAPYGVAELGEEIDLGNGWTLEVSAGAGGVLGYGVKFSPDLGLEPGALDGGTGGDARFNIRLGLFKESDTGTRVVVFGEEGGSRLEVGKVGVGTGLEIAIGEEGRWFIEGVLERGQIVVANKDSDGFLARILPPDGFTAPFDLVVGWATDQGLYFQGSAALEVTLPVHKELGPLRIDSVYLRLGIDAEGKLQIALAAAVSAELGPISASVDRIGADLRTTLERSPQFVYGFVPPTGAGLSVDADIIFGGGYLEFDTLNERYAGILALNLAEFAITAIGLITTKMPDGSKDFSMLINIGIEFDPEIQLSMGFTLSGVGGLIGINRAMVIEELQKRFRSGAVNDILFPDPKTVIPRADTIIENMRAVFPPARGKFVIGPMVKIGYGSPNVIQADIGIILVLPDLSEYAILGKLKAAFPTPEEETIKINMSLLGTLSLAKKEFTFQSSIYDSEILKIALWGDIAARLCWSDPPEFTMAMGGFHPKFTPPPPEIIFGDLRRLGLNVVWGEEIFLLCESYIALTPNSLQFGAAVQIIVNFGELHADGSFSFDALFYFKPFSFEISADASVNVTIGGVSLIDADIDLFLSGPTPWHARGSATVRILFFDVTGDFNITWGQRGVPLIPAIDPLDDLVEALNDNHNWSARLPHTRSMVEALQPMEEADAAGSLVVHPYGSLEVIQRVLPLGIRLDKFGHSPITGHDQFDIKRISIGSQVGNRQYQIPQSQVKEHVNLGTYKKLTKSEKLSKPSFEKMTVGVGFSSDPIAFGGNREFVSHNYESVYLTQEELPKTADANGVLDRDDARLLNAGSAAAKSKQLTSGNRKFVKLDQLPLTRVNEMRYAIADLTTFTRADGSDVDGQDVDGQDVDGLVGEDDRSLWHVEQVLAAYIAKNPWAADTYIVVAEYELQEAA